MCVCRPTRPHLIYPVMPQVVRMLITNCVAEILLYFSSSPPPLYLTPCCLLPSLIPCHLLHLAFLLSSSHSHSLSLPLLLVYVVEDRRRDDTGDTCLTACWTALCCCCLWDMLT
uniref:Cysteine-rich and transmembrane domain-containing protein 1 n=1 Tax=Myripristis murdjan TaxID=586833 RepID=A0A668AEZ7_9TELE